MQVLLRARPCYKHAYTECAIQSPTNLPLEKYQNNSETSVSKRIYHVKKELMLIVLTDAENR